MTSWATEFDSGDVAWMLIVTVLPSVLMAWGLALVLPPRVQGNELDGVFCRLPLLISALLLAWGLWIYSLAFGPSWGTVPSEGASYTQSMIPLQEMLLTDDIHEDKTDLIGRGGLVGGTNYFAMNDVLPVGATDGPHFPVRRPHMHVPHVLECLFRWTSLLIAMTPLWIVWSERFRAGWIGVVSILWSTFVFAPIAHWLWGDGWLEQLGAVDFGGSLILIAVACSALKWNLGVRSIESGESDVTPRYGFGAILLWLGAAMFISAQSFHADGRAALVLFNVLLGTSAGILVWAVANCFVWKVDSLHSLGVGIAACVAGLASSAGIVLPQSAIIIGAFLGFLANVCWHMGLKNRRASRSLLFSTLGMCAAAGMLCAGVFATTSAAAARWDGRPVIGALEGNPVQLLHQVAGVCSVAAWAFCGSWLIYKGVDIGQRLAGGNASPPESAADDRDPQ